MQHGHTSNFGNTLNPGGIPERLCEFLLGGGERVNSLAVAVEDIDDRLEGFTRLVYVCAVDEGQGGGGHGEDGEEDRR